MISFDICCDVCYGSREAMGLIAVYEKYLSNTKEDYDEWVCKITGKCIQSNAKKPPIECDFYLEQTYFGEKC